MSRFKNNNNDAAAVVVASKNDNVVETAATWIFKDDDGDDDVELTNWLTDVKENDVDFAYVAATAALHQFLCLWRKKTKLKSSNNNITNLI